MTAVPEPVRIDLDKQTVLLDNGETVSITNMFDDEGKDTDDLDEVAAIVAGPMRNGEWLAITIGADEVLH